MTRTIRLALATFAVGFLVEAGTELYQFLSYGIRLHTWIGLYYVGLLTTGLGFYLMYRGRHEWTDAHRRRVIRGHQHLATAVAIFVGALIAIAVLSQFSSFRSGGASASPFAWVVGGLVAVSFANFFLGLTTLVARLVGRWGRLCAWAGFAWSLGVAVLTGAIVGGEFPTLLDQFFSDPLALIVSFAPLAFVIAPLFVSYLLFAAAYLDAWRALRRTPAGPPKEPVLPSSDRPVAGTSPRPGSP